MSTMIRTPRGHRVTSGRPIRFRPSNLLGVPSEYCVYMRIPGTTPLFSASIGHVARMEDGTGWVCWEVGRITLNDTIQSNLDAAMGPFPLRRDAAYHLYLMLNRDHDNED